MMRNLESGFSFEVDTAEKASWHSMLENFRDTTMYQTWSYGSIRWGEPSLSHIILKKDAETVAMAQLRIAKLPVGRIGFAYLPWGPVWKKKDQEDDTTILRNMLRALYNEYACRRGYLLQCLPKANYNNYDIIRTIFTEEGFSWSPDSMQTVYINLSPSLESIRANTRGKWRQTLNRALKQKLEFKQGSSDQVYDIASSIILEMKKRKNFVEFGSMEDIIEIDIDLPDNLKLCFLLCIAENNPVAVLGWFPIGEIGLPLVGATNNNALQYNASYPLYWKMVEYYKDKGAACIDLGGINKERNPGGYLFKTGLAGKNRIEKNYVGQFDACNSFLSLLFFKKAMSLRQSYRNFLVKLNKAFK